MSVKDVVKKSFLQGFGGTDMTLKNMVLCLVVAALLGIFIYMVYRIMTTNTFYSKTFNMSLMLLSVITAAMILTIQNSVIVSLGMVGALSIVRFRTAVKEPLDLIFLFWSICAGIISGAGMIGLAIVLSVVVTVLMLVFYHFPEQRKSIILAINISEFEKTAEVLQAVKRHDAKYREKSRNMAAGRVDVMLEIRLKDYEPLLQELHEMTCVQAVSLITHKGEVG